MRGDVEMHRSNRNQLSLEVRSEIWLPRGLRSGLLATVFTLLVTACGPGSSTDLNTDTTVVSASSSATASEATTTTADLSAVLEPTTTSDPMIHQPRRPHLSSPLPAS